MEKQNQMNPSQRETSRKEDSSSHSKGNYKRFALMILTSTVIMHLLTFANVFQLDHIYLSQVRIYMSLMMGSMMAIVMLLFMWKMYKDKRLNKIILAASTLVFLLSFWLVQNQTLIGDEAWMRAMIPHHSSAIMTSERANLTDPEVKKLAEEIIKAQEEEISRMRDLIEKINK